MMLGSYRLIQLVLGLTVWSVWFALSYGGLSLGCVVAPPPNEQGPLNWLTLALGAWTLVVVCLLMMMGWRCFQASRRGSVTRGQRFVAGIGAGVHLGGLIATVGVAFPLLLMPPCL